MEYNDKMSAEQQITTEEKIASLIFYETPTGEETSGELGRQILKMVLKEFRPDLFAED